MYNTLKENYSLYFYLLSTGKLDVDGSINLIDKYLAEVDKITKTIQDILKSVTTKDSDELRDATNRVAKDFDRLKEEYPIFYNTRVVGELPAFDYKNAYKEAGKLVAKTSKITSINKTLQEVENTVTAIKIFNNREADTHVIACIRQTMFNLMNVSAAINKLADFGARSLNSLMLFATWDGDKCKSYKDVVRKINNELGNSFGLVDLKVSGFITRAIAEAME